MKKVLSLIAAVLVLATCLTFAVGAASEIAVANVAVDCQYNNAPARPEACIAGLRSGTDLWFNASTDYEPTSGSIANPGERYLTLGLAETADLSEIQIQWYQGGSSQTDAASGTKARSYTFVIQASKEATGEENFVDIYGNYSSGDIKNSSTGTDHEKISVNFTDAKRIRIWGFGNDGGAGNEGASNFAIRDIKVLGTGKGGEGGQAGQSGNDGSGKHEGTTGGEGGTTNPGGNGGSTTTPGGNGGNGGSQAPTTGDFENLLIFGTVAVLSCAAVVIIRKKIRER